MKLFEVASIMICLILGIIFAAHLDRLGDEPQAVTFKEFEEATK